MFAGKTIGLGLVLAVAAAAAPPPATPGRPTPAQVAAARAYLRQRAAERRAVVDRTTASDLWAAGYFQRVTDRRERAAAVAGFERRLRKLGISAKVGRCAWMGMLAAGVADGNHAYGAACNMRIGGKAAADFLICDDDMGGITLSQPEWYAFDDEYIELFLRRACF